MMISLTPSHVFGLLLTVSCIQITWMLVISVRLNRLSRTLQALLLKEV